MFRRRAGQSVAFALFEQICNAHVPVDICNLTGNRRSCLPWFVMTHLFRQVCCTCGMSHLFFAYSCGSPTGSFWNRSPVLPVLQPQFIRNPVTAVKLTFEERAGCLSLPQYRQTVFTQSVCSLDDQRIVFRFPAG